MFDRGTLSDVLGALSILTWLGAQSPQIYENYKNQSVEGLALPFLISWFWGDFTNFVGCVLTHQLPFQTYLATYFLFVDVALVGQYWVYSRRKPPQDLPPLSETFPYAQGPGPNHPPYVHPRKASKSRKRRSRSSRGYPSSTSHDDLLRASFMSEASARSAPTPNAPPHTRENSSALPSNSTSLYTRTEPPSPTLPERGRTLTRAPLHSTFDPTLSTIYGSPAGDTPFYPIHSQQQQQQQEYHSQSSHHVSFNESTEALNQHQQQHPTHPSRGSSSRSRPPPPSRRNTGIAFLSVGMLFTLGTLGGGGGGALVTMDVDKLTAGGTAWSTTNEVSTIRSNKEWKNDLRYPTFFSFRDTDSPTRKRLSKRSTYPVDVSLIPSSTASSSTYQVEPEHFRSNEGGHKGEERPPPPPGPDYERIFGRTSAWLCTTLYLTSRLPQIWRNFRRRSVEGLAMTLFFFAFIGNSLYVASILTNPSSIEPGYLVESLPYLLGSGGTLCFDLMIIAQSYLYSEKRKLRKEVQHERRRRNVSRSHSGIEGGRARLNEEEEAALLQTDLEDGEIDTETDYEPSVATTEGSLSRGRNRPLRTSLSRNSSVGYGRSISSGRRTNLSMSRCTSTELLAQHGRDYSQTPSTRLDDRPFDFSTADTAGRTGGGGVEVSSGRRSLSRSRASSGSIPTTDSIPEEVETSPITGRDHH